MDDPDLDPIDETAKPDLSDSELSDVDEEAYAGIDTSRIGVESDEDEEPSVFALRPAKLKTGTGERKKKKVESKESTEEKRRKRQERRQERDDAKKRKTFNEVQEDFDMQDPNRRPDDPEEARRWDLDRAMDSAVSRKPVKRRKKDDDIVHTRTNVLILGP
jgi:hypothetical protein